MKIFGCSEQTVPTKTKNHERFALWFSVFV